MDGFDPTRFSSFGRWGYNPYERDFEDEDEEHNELCGCADCKELVQDMTPEQRERRREAASLILELS